MAVMWLRSTSMPTPIKAMNSTIHVRPMADILATAPASAWRPLADEHTLYMELPAGRVIIELEPALAPQTVANIEAMARAGARLLGGCCGTTPEFIREAGRRLEAAGLIPGHPSHV